MRRKLVLYCVIVLCFFSGLTGYAQVRVGKLVVNKKQVYELGQSDILVADTLIMEDSSTIQLNSLKRENYIRAQVVIIGNNCTIRGHGLDGSAGLDGRNGDSPVGPCRDGEDARPGGKGLDGGSGINLFLYFEQVVINSRCIIDLSGGQGGQGGNGGYGGAGSPGTLHCQGGDGGNGGNGGAGGSGGRGGTLYVSCVQCVDVRALVKEKIELRNWGGNFGYGGRGGYAGSPGLGPSKAGAKGFSGSDGANGDMGEKGDLDFEIN